MGKKGTFHDLDHEVIQQVCSADLQDLLPFDPHHSIGPQTPYLFTRDFLDDEMWHFSTGLPVFHTGTHRAHSGHTRRLRRGV